jgi:hypothetical protein
VVAPEHEVAEREDEGHEQQGERRSLATALPQADEGGGQADVAADEEPGEHEAVLGGPLEGLAQVVVDRVERGHEALAAEPEGVQRVGGGDRELEEPAGDVPVVGQGGDEERQQGCAAHEERAQQVAHPVAVADDGVAGEGRAPEHRVVGPGHEDPAEEDAGDDDPRGRAEPGARQQEGAEQQAEAQGEEVAEVDAALDGEDR